MTKEQAAIDRIKKAEAEIAEAKRLLEEPEPKIGKLCAVWDDDPKVFKIRILTYILDCKYGFVDIDGSSWKHARLLTQEEKEKYL